MKSKYVAQSDWSLDRHTHKIEHAQTITRNAATFVPSTCIRALCTSAMAASLPPLFPLQTHVFHTPRLFLSLPRGFLPCQSQCRKSCTLTRVELYVLVYVTATVFHSPVVYGLSNKDYGYCARACRPLDGTFKFQLQF